MPANIDYSDVTHVGRHRFEQAPTVPDGSFGDSQMSASSPLLATKVKHQYVKVAAQVHGSAAAAERRVVHVARSSGEVTAFEAGIVVAAVGDSTVSVDLRKNGTTILSAPVSISSAQAAYAEVAGTISGGSYSAGDVFEVVITVTAGTGTLPQGLYADAVFREGSG